MDQAPAPTPDSTKKGRAPNWTMTKEEQLAISWIVISQNAKFANNQSGNQFYKKVAEHFKNASTIHPCSADQLKNRWKSINTSTLKFSGIYGAIARNPPSGTAPSDYMDIAKRKYSNQRKEQFKDEVSWQVLRYAPKWAAAGNPISSTCTTPFSGISSPPTQSTPPPESIDSIERPIGQKKTKRQQEDHKIEIKRNNKLKRATDIQEHKAVVMEKAHELAERALKLEEEAKRSVVYKEYMTTLMTSADTCPDDESRKILKLMKARLLKKYREAEAADSN